MTRRRVVAAALVVLLATALSSPAVAVSRRHRLLRWTNHERVERGIRGVRMSWSVSQLANLHSLRMAASDRIWHVVRLGRKLRARGVEFDEARDIVGVTPVERLRAVFVAFMRSASHRRVILDRAFRHVGVGVVQARGSLWITMIFYG